MPIIDKRDKNNWYNRLPLSNPRETGYNPFLDPEFDISRMKENEFRQADGTVIAKIPVIEGRIHYRHDKDRNNTYVIFVSDAYYDKTKGQMRNEKITIGTALGGRFEGLMIANNNYHTYFDMNGNLVYDPLKQRQEQKAREEAEEEAKKVIQQTLEAAERTAEKTKQQGKEAVTPKRSNTPTAAQQTLKTAANPQPPDEEERTVDEIKASLLEKEKQLKEKLKRADEGLKQLQEAQEQLKNIEEARLLSLDEKAKAHLNLLDSILSDYSSTIRNQAKSKPDKFMRAAQVQTINRILSELRDYFSGSDAEDYLQLAPEPVEQDLENHPGTTYGEMDLLLSAYSNTIHTFRFGHLYYKN